MMNGLEFLREIKKELGGNLRDLGDFEIFGGL
jgi:hypothetical protein